MIMVLITHLGLVVFVIYSPIFLLLLFISVKKYPGYSLTSLWMSNLGDTRYESCKLFNLAWLFYGFFCLFFVYGLSKILPNMFYSSIAVLLLYLSSVFTILASLIPINKNLILHHICTLIVSVSITTSYLLLLLPMYISQLIPKYFMLFNMLLIFISVFFAISFLKLIRKQGKIPLTLSDLRKNEKSFFIRNTAAQEWIFILLVIIWNFVMSLVALQNL